MIIEKKWDLHLVWLGTFIEHLVSLNTVLEFQLIFCIPTYEMVIDAYLNGLECSGLSDLSGISSAAAFYISRVDGVVDAELEKIATSQAIGLRGKVNSHSTTI